MLKPVCVYMLRCSDDTYYTSVSAEIENRLQEHQEGLYRDCYTYPRRPVELVFCCEFTDPIEADKRMKQLKKWPGPQKEAAIENEVDGLKNMLK
ncbi:GIY-YIG nuclease family protein [Sinomicrobium sp. M5D2P17]